MIYKWHIFLSSRQDSLHKDYWNFCGNSKDLLNENFGQVNPNYANSLCFSTVNIVKLLLTTVLQLLRSLQVCCEGYSEKHTTIHCIHRDPTMTSYDHTMLKIDKAEYEAKIATNHHLHQTWSEVIIELPTSCDKQKGAPALFIINREDVQQRSPLIPTLTL